MGLFRFLGGRSDVQTKDFRTKDQGQKNRENLKNLLNPGSDFRTKEQG
jgi:hypothetical protein